MNINKSILQTYQQEDNLKNTSNETPFIIPHSSTTVVKIRKNTSYLGRQIFASAGPVISTIASGTVAGYSAVLLPQLQANDSIIKVTENESSWIASMAPLFMAVGCIGGGITMERYGRKMSQLIGYVPFVIGWLVISLALNWKWILAGRFLTGFCAGWLGASLFVFIAEITNPKYRGPLLAGTSLGISLGILIVHILGTFLPWKITAAIAAILPLISFIVLALSPESPSWLLTNGRIKDAALSFMWLRGVDVDSCNEFECMVNNVSANKNSSYSWSNLRINIVKSEFIKPFIILTGFMMIMQFAGTNAIIFYSVTIFRQTFKLTLDEYVVMILVDVIRVLMSAVGCIVLKKFNRRTIAILSSLLTAFTLFALSSFIYLALNNEEIQKYSWIPLALILCYISSISIGLVPLPWCMIGELFPLALRGLGSALTSSICFVWFFTVVKTSPALFAAYGSEGAFLAYGMVALFGCLFLALILPETKNRTLQDIENDFK